MIRAEKMASNWQLATETAGMSLKDTELSKHQLLPQPKGQAQIRTS